MAAGRSLFLSGAANPRAALLGLLIVEPLFVIPLWLLRMGHFPIAATATVAVFEFLVVAASLAPGPATPGLGAAFTIPMTIAALVLRRPGLLVVTAISIAATWIGRILPDHAAGSLNGTVNLTIELLILGLVLDRFGVSLRDALAGQLRHSRDVEAA